jgi:TP901 family phage tail tape measure protein
VSKIDLLDLFIKIGIQDEASEGVESISEKLGNGLKTAAKVGAAAITAASTAVVAFGKSAIEAGSTFDTSMSQVAATMGKTVDEIGDLRDFALEMGANTAFSASQAADALNYMALAGYDAEESMQALPNVLNLAAAGGMELATASDMVTDAQSALGLTMEESTEMVDKMAAAASSSNTSVSQLGEAILTIGGTAKDLAGGTTELSTALGLLADNGIKGAEGGTHLRNIMLALESPTDTAAAALTNLGVEVFDAEGNMRSLEDVFGDLNTAMEGMTSADKTNIISTIFNKTDIASVNALLATSTDRWDELSAAIDGSTGAAEAMAGTQLDNLTGDVTLFKSALEGAQIVLSDQLTPYLREFVEFGTSGITQLSEAFQEGGLSGAMDAFGDVLGDGLTMILNEVPQIVEAGGQLLLALGKGIWNSVSQVAPVLQESALAFMSNFGSYLKENLPTLLQTGLESVVSLTSSIRENAGLIVDGALSLAENLATGLAESIPTIVENVPTIVSNIAGVINDNAPKMLASAAKIIGTLVIGLIASIPTIIVNMPKIIAAIWDTITAVNWLNLGASIIEGLGNGLKSMVSFAKSSIETIKKALKEGVEKLPETFLQIGKNIIQGLIDGISSMASLAVQAAKSVGESIVSSVTGLLGIQSPSKVFKGIGAYMMEGLSIGMENASADVLDTVSGIVKDVNNGFDFGTANVDFASSGLGMSSAGIINSVSGATGGSDGSPLTVNLVLPDGTKFASWQLPYLIKAADANGTPIASGQYA